MTAQLLTSELSNLAQDSKRKSPELRNVAEKSLADLKALPRTSEAQIAADLKCRPTFVKPFLLACGTRNPKFAGSGVICLQRLIVSNALPRETLEEVLEALRECSTLALDIQLKVLQALPSLLQNYASSLTGRLLVAAFQVCFLLYNSKTAVVSNTAAAALQQLVNAIFEKAATGEDEPSEERPAAEVSIGDGTVSICGAALDAYRILDDICLMTELQKAKSLPGASLAQNFGLELVESILTNHADTIMAHPEQIHVLRIRLLPHLIKALSERSSFSTTVRTMRLLQLILSRLLFALASECEMALSLLNHMLDPDAAVLWKRALCLEVFRAIHSEPALVRSIYAHYDEADGKRNIVKDHLGNLVRLASEKPAIVGLGQQSSIPSVQNDSSSEQAAIQAGGLIGSIGGVVTTTDMNTPGISNRWSTIRIPCLEQLDKSEAPALPATYIYSLALTCITSFSEGLARFLLPFTVPNEPKVKRKQVKSQDDEYNSNSVDGDRPAKHKLSRSQSSAGRKVPVNPLSLKDHVLYNQISSSGRMVDQCWPALLAASSTYLNATMDSEHYHALIRSFQKFTQIAGLLGLTTPRDAFLTTLGKHAVPSNTSSKSLRSIPSSIPVSHDDTSDTDHTTDSDPSPASTAPIKRPQSLDMTIPTMNTRHLLCLRALLNLGIALGPVLHKSWSIILETLQQADLIIFLSGAARRSQTSRAVRLPQNEAEDPDDNDDLGLEITAAETAASRMFESTSELLSEAFLSHLGCLCGLLDGDASTTEPAAKNLLSPKPGPRKHQKLRSVSGTSMETSVVDRESVFVLEKLGVVIRSNVARLLQGVPYESGWDVLMKNLVSRVSSPSERPDVRIKAATTLNEMIVSVALSSDTLSSDDQGAIRARSFDVLLREINSLDEATSQGTKSSQNTDFEIHSRALDASRSILEDCGDSLATGWESVFAIITTTFDATSNPTDPHTASPSLRVRPTSPKLVRSSFGSLQLICSDFLNYVPASSLLQLLDTLYSFSAQDQDLNISLTTATFFRNISDFLLRDHKSIDFRSLPSDDPSDADLKELANSQIGESSSSALWLCLLSRLVKLTTDHRPEVRHSIQPLAIRSNGSDSVLGALHTLFRIFDACGDQITLTNSRVCFKAVLSKLLSVNEAHYIAAKETEDSGFEGWNETAVVLIDGVSKIFSQWLDAFNNDRHLQEIWTELLDHLSAFLNRDILDVSKATFAGISRMLAEIENVESGTRNSAVDKVWVVWEKKNPAQHLETSKRGQGNQDALLAYLNCLAQLLRLLVQTIKLEQIQVALEQLRICVIESTASSYSTDIDQMTPVQKAVLGSLKTIPTKMPEAVSKVLDYINYFVTLAYKREDVKPGTKRTFVAFSKGSMAMLGSFAMYHLHDANIDASDLVTKALVALDIPIHLKYTWDLEGKDPPPWKKATSTAVTILEASMPLQKDGENTNLITPLLCESVVGVVDGIVTADCAAAKDPSAIFRDEDFDIDAFSRVRRLITPSLGSSTIADSVRRKYTESLFQNSLIHEPHPDDLARRGQELLEGLQSNHIGRVQDLPPTPRSRLCYLLLDELFDLVAVHDGSPERIKLAQAAAPYLILRTGLVLKAYIFDQPLRGQMPQPWSQKREMFHILRKLIELDSEPKAIPAAPGISSRYKKHLHRLYPHVVRAMRVAWRDKEMVNALQKVLEVVGDDFGT